MKHVHLLRPFTKWGSGPSVQDGLDWIKALRGTHGDDGLFYTATRRRPSRKREMVSGGSVYFCKGGVTRFRMPCIGVVPRGGWWWIEMELKAVEVEPLRVGFLRGYRYLEPEDAPRDIDLPDEPPDNVDEILRDMGVVTPPAAARDG